MGIHRYCYGWKIIKSFDNIGSKHVGDNFDYSFAVFLSGVITCLFGTVLFKLIAFKPPINHRCPQNVFCPIPCV